MPKIFHDIHSNFNAMQLGGYKTAPLIKDPFNKINFSA